MNKTEETKKESLVFNTKWQEATFGHMMLNPSFFTKCKQHLEPNWFKDPRVYTLVSLLYKFYEKFKKHPTQSEYITTQINTELDPKEKGALKAAYEKCLIASSEITINIISKEMTGWIQWSKFKDSAEQIPQKFTQGNFNEAISWIDKKIAEVKTASFEPFDVFDFRNPAAFYESLAEEQADGVSTGSKIFDSLLVGDVSAKNQIPGLERKKMTVVIGPANSGKTSLMVTFARHTIMQDKKVLYITHEGNKESIVQKIYQAFYNRNAAELSEYLSRNPTEANLEASKLANNLIYKSMNPTGPIYVEDVLNYIKVININEIEKDGRPIDLIIDDYPAKLFSRDYVSGKGAERRMVETYIYNQFELLADELNCHVIAPVQTNRESFKKARDGAEFLDMDSVAESFGIAQVADNVLTINRSEKDMFNNIMFLYVAKSRSTRTGTFYASQVDLSKSLMYGPGQGLKEWPGDGKKSVESIIQETLIK